MTDDQPHASEWEPDRSKSAQDWLIEALLDEDHYEPYRFVRLHGQAFEPALLPAGFQPGVPKCCFANAFRLASSHPNLKYVEGYGTLWNSDKWLYRHAWCVDENGSVVDPTWGTQEPLPLALRGLELPLSVVAPFASEFSRGTLEEGLRDQLDVVASSLGLPWPL